jgi:hypothetical protein
MKAINCVIDTPVSARAGFAIQRIDELYQFSFASNPLSALVPRAAYTKNSAFEAALLCPWGGGLGACSQDRAFLGQD